MLALRRLPMLLLLLALTACDALYGDCALIPRPGIALQVIDARTGASLGRVATVTVRLLTPPMEELTGKIEGDPNGSPLNLAVGRPGTYLLFAAAPGFVPETTQVTVRDRGDCKSVETESAILRLTPE